MVRLGLGEPSFDRPKMLTNTNILHQGFIKVAELKMLAKVGMNYYKILLIDRHNLR